MINLGKLESVDLYQVWAKEHEDFTLGLLRIYIFSAMPLGHSIELVTI